VAVALLSCTPDPEADDDDSGPASSSSLEATSTRTRLVDGVEVCSESYELVGTPYAGDCPDCLFAFELQSTLAQASGDCVPDARLTWAADGAHSDIRLALAERYELPSSDSGPTPVTNAVLWGTSSPALTYYGGTVPPEAWEIVGYEGAADLGAVSWDGETLEVETELHSEEFVYNPDLFRECDPYAYSGLTAFGPTDEVLGTVRCDTSTFDAWEFEASEGSVVRVWADNQPTSAPEEALGPMIGLTDATNCLLAGGLPSFPCASSPSPGLECPGIQITAPSTGSYRLLVVGQGYPCQQGSAGYVLRGNVDDVPLVFSSSLDDAPVGTATETEERASLVARIVR
jgi:hypothetical protein